MQKSACCSLALCWLVAGCGHDGQKAGGMPDLATAVGDDGGAPDAASGGDDLGVAGGDDLSVAGDLAATSPGDLARSLLPPDLANADLALSGNGPVTLSTATRADTGCPLVATGPSGTFSIWEQSSAVAKPGAVTIDSWAFSSTGGTTTHGDYGPPKFGGGTCGGSLVPVGSSFLYSSPKDGVFIFDGTKLTRLAPGSYSAVASGAYVLVVPGPYSSSSTLAVYDASAAKLSSLNLGTYYELAAGGDGNGNFGVTYLTLSSSAPANSTATVNFRTYGAGTWNAPETVTTAFAPMSNYTFRQFSVAAGAGTWAVSWVNIGGATTPLSVAVRGSGGSWTTSGSFNIIGSYTSSGVYLLSGNSATIAVGAAGSSSNFASVYSAGTWTTTTLDTSLTDTIFSLQPTASGYVMAWGFAAGTAHVSVFDGASWSSAFAVGHQPSVAAGAAGVAVASTTSDREPSSSQVAIYAGGAWSSSTMASAQSDGAAVAATANGFIANYVAPGTIAARVWSPSAWAAPANLPSSPEEGDVIAMSLAEAGNGHALAFWSQYDAAQVLLFASEFDGSQWGAAVQLANLSYMTFPPEIQVIAAPIGFVLGWWDGVHGEVAVWAGPSTTATMLPPSNGSPQLASSGATLMAIWPDNSGIEYATSSDGVTWSASSNVEPAGWGSVSLVANASGWLELSYNGQMRQAQARVYQGGSWSAPSAAMAPTGACAVAAADASFLATCRGSVLDAEWWNAGAFTHLPVTTSTVTSWALASDGTSYRVEYDGKETILSNGAWSAAVSEPTLSGLPMLGLASLGYTWELLTQTGQTLERAAVAGGDVFGAATAVESSTATLMTSLLAAGPTRADALWTKLSGGALLAAVLYARTGI